MHLLQSGLARMPAVIKYFKPVILFPAGMLVSLPPNEVEAILIHEAQKQMIQSKKGNGTVKDANGAVKKGDGAIANNAAKND